MERDAFLACRNTRCNINYVQCLRLVAHVPCCCRLIKNILLLIPRPRPRIGVYLVQKFKVHVTWPNLIPWPNLYPCPIKYTTGIFFRHGQKPWSTVDTIGSVLVIVATVGQEHILESRMFHTHAGIITIRGVSELFSSKVMGREADCAMFCPPTNTLVHADDSFLLVSCFRGKRVMLWGEGGAKLMSQ